MEAVAKAVPATGWLKKAELPLVSIRGNADKAFTSYQLVMYPEGETGAAVKLLTKKLKEIFPAELKIHSKAHIELGSFYAREEMEETIIRWIQRICNAESRFVVTMNNFGSVPPHVLYLRIQDHQPFFRLISKLRVIDNYIFLNGYGEVEWSSRPVCKLADQLQPGFDHSKIKDYAKLDYHANFLAYNLVLLKSTSLEEEPVVVNVFPLYP